MSPATKYVCWCCMESMDRETPYVIDGFDLCDGCMNAVYAALREPTKTAIKYVRLRKRLEKEAGNV